MFSEIPRMTRTSKKSRMCPLEADPSKIAECLETIEDMEERDVAACENWRIAQGWAQVNLPYLFRLLVSPQSPLALVTASWGSSQFS